jgi:CheY-like chemotaxis protein
VREGIAQTEHVQFPLLERGTPSGIDLAQGERMDRYGSNPPSAAPDRDLDVDVDLGARTRPTKRPPARSPKRGTPRLRLRNLPVLVVDDDPASAKLVSIVLRAEGCVTRIAESAEEALAILPTFHPRLIVLDLVLPLMSGLLFAQKLKADPETRDIVIVAVTAFNGAAAERMARDAGCALYIRKPIDPIALPKLLSTHLGGGS